MKKILDVVIYGDMLYGLIFTFFGAIALILRTVPVFEAITQFGLGWLLLSVGLTCSFLINHTAEQ